MGKVGKLQKFAEVTSFENCYERAPELKGKWKSDIFKNDNPITVELACGKGEYTIGLAERFPNRNFIGIDVKGNRIWKGAKYALENKITNVAFHRLMIGNIEEYFAMGEIDEFWITFPDPQHAKKRKRLTNGMFLNRYRAISKPGAIMNLKSDSTRFYEFTKEIIAEQNLEVLQDSDDIYAWDDIPEYLANIQTFYEKMWLADGKKIKYLRYIL
ncbi:tRNA (guanosine(46)-N7)-methyltransferase TrmB [Bacteroidia bacterium]|nr:tRNA (guanosine(46)-N7)-methyltransferase TrmB [Bacteroidota bacterium]MDA9111059.1 tRNA (guanosine(46)-N7)-methyltransferase TrmB [Bacteroidia bacterium]MDB4173469.1 tRNA (guanosine(46)-N7)-methyltransferase TrmB [Bacteroidia bacterium]